MKKLFLVFFALFAFFVGFGCFGCCGLALLAGSLARFFVLACCAVRLAASFALLVPRPLGASASPVVALSPGFQWPMAHDNDGPVLFKRAIPSLLAVLLSTHHHMGPHNPDANTSPPLVHEPAGTVLGCGFGGTRGITRHTSHAAGTPCG